MADLGGGIDSPAIEQNVDIAKIQAAQLGTQAAIAVALPPTGFVASIDGLTGLVTFTAGTGISITNDGVGNFTFTATLTVPKNNITAAPPTPGNDEFEG